MGDMNADPIDGDSADNAILQLLDHPRIPQHSAPASLGGQENAQLNPDANEGHKGNPAHDVWGLRVDYVLPSTELKVCIKFLSLEINFKAESSSHLKVTKPARLVSHL
jgi:hypothetical protein